MNLIKKWLSRKRPHEDTAYALYDAIVTQARRPEFFSQWQVPDTIDGRFEMLALHAHMIMRRIDQDRDGPSALSQALFDVMFMDMDRSLRELGVGDMGVGRRVKQMMQAFYGRAGAYDAGLTDPSEALKDALKRNLYGTTDVSEETLAALAAYVREIATILAEAPAPADGRTEINFPPPPS